MVISNFRTIGIGHFLDHQSTEHFLLLKLFPLCVLCFSISVFFLNIFNLLVAQRAEVPSIYKIFQKCIYFPLFLVTMTQGSVSVQYIACGGKL